MLLVRAERQVKNNAIRRLNAEQMILARQAAKSIEDFFEAQTRLLSALAENPHVVSMDQEGREIVARLMDASAGMAQGLTRVSRDGVIVYSYPDTSVTGRDLSSQEHIKKILKQHQPVLSDVFFTVQGFPSVALHVPVFAGERFDGTLAMLIPFAAISRNYLETIHVAESGYAFVISEGGLELYCPIPGHVGRTVFENAKDYPDFLAMAERMTRGEEGLATYHYDQIRDRKPAVSLRYAVFVPVHLENALWSICIATPDSEVLIDIKDFQTTWYGIMALLALSIGIGAYVFLKAIIFIGEERQRRAAEEALRQSERKYRLLMDNALFPIVVVAAADGRILFVNETTSRLMGMPAETIVGLRAVDFWIVPEERDRYIAELCHAGKVAEFEARLKLGSGGSMTALLSADRIEFEDQPAYFTVFSDITARKRAEAAIARERQFTDAVLDSVPGLLYLYDDQGRLLRWNKKHGEITGYTDDELSRMHLHDWYRGDQATIDRIDRAIERVYRDGYGHEEAELQTKSGAKILFYFTAVHLVIDGKSYFTGIGLDITERKQVEEALRESEQRFLLFMEQLPAAVFIKDADGKVLFTNSYLDALFGWKDTAAKTTDRLLPAEVAGQMMEDDRRALEEGYLNVRENLVDRQGQHRTFDTHKFAIPASGGRRMLGGIALDITERVRSELALVEAERRYREIFEQAPIAIFQALPEGRFQAVNPEYARIIGYESPEAMVRGITDIGVQMYDDPVMRERYKWALAEYGAVTDFEVQLRRRDGSSFWAAMNSRVIRNERGEIVLYEGFLIDITARKQVEEAKRLAHENLEGQVAERTRELREANTQLVELNRQKSTFLSSASHELRTPLTSILGFTKIILRTFQRHFLPLAESPELREKSRTIVDDLAIIETEGTRLTRLVNDLLDLNKIEAGRMAWRDEDLDVANLVAAVVRQVSYLFLSSPQVAFETRVAPDLPRLRADRDRITQVLTNMLDNAVKFTAAGRIVLAVDAPQPEWLEIRLTDSGPGVPAAERELVFDKFYQVDGGAESGHKPKGTGLGLAICRQIVEHYGGTIQVADGADGCGACFVVRLPVGGRGALEVTDAGAA